jgi:hypothetical protein
VVLARAGDAFTLRQMPSVAPGQLALRRVVTRRGAAVIDGNRYRHRLISLAPLASPGRLDRLRSVNSIGQPRCRSQDVGLADRRRISGLVFQV